MTSVTSRHLGVEDVRRDLRERLPLQAKRVEMRAMKASVEVIRLSIVANVPKATTRGHSEVSVQNAIGGRVWSPGGRHIMSKVGVGVGKKQGTYRPNAVFQATGTDARWTGSRGIKQRVKERVGRGHMFQSRWTVGRREQTGHARKYRGRVLKTGMVSRGVSQGLPAARRKFVDVVNRAFKRSRKP